MRAAVIVVNATIVLGGAARPPVEAPRPVLIEARTLDGRIVGFYTGPDAILHCVMTANDDALEGLLREGHELNPPSATGWTFLHRAAFQGSPKTVRLLLEHGAEVDARTENGLTPLDIARNRGRGDVVDVLEEYKVE